MAQGVKTPTAPRAFRYRVDDTVASRQHLLVPQRVNNPEMHPHRLAWLRAAYECIPKILTLQDRNPHSPTYGCFDRNYWQFRIVDFPSGMSQEFIYPLALLWAHPLPGNAYYRNPAIAEYVVAGLRFAEKSSHPDGSCDDYYPYEKAAGATAFSLLACVESYRLLGLRDARLLTFFSRRLEWLNSHLESGRLTNHQALIALCTELLSRVVGTHRWDKQRDERIQIVLDWQDPEGWFHEYEGFDPGYHTLTVSCLARLLAFKPSRVDLRKALEKAVEVTAEMVYPDGTFGGEIGSRNTYNFFPHGFELLGHTIPQALAINDAVVRQLLEGIKPAYEDDHLIGHHTWNYILTGIDFHRGKRPDSLQRTQGRVYFPAAGILIDRRAQREVYIALNKGGVFKIFVQGRLVATDTQLSVTVQNSKRDVRNAVGHLMGGHARVVEKDTIRISGCLSWAKHKVMTPLRLLLLRLVMLTVGKYRPDLIRRLLQRLLIIGAEPAPFTYSRTFSWDEQGGLSVRDEYRSDQWHKVIDAGISGHQTSNYVVMSRVFTPGQLQPWYSLAQEAKEAQHTGTLVLQRVF